MTVLHILMQLNTLDCIYYPIHPNFTTSAKSVDKNCLIMTVLTNLLFSRARSDLLSFLKMLHFRFTCRNVESRLHHRFVCTRTYKSERRSN